MTDAGGPRLLSGLPRPPAPCTASEARLCRTSSTTSSVVFTWSVVSRNQQVSSCNSLIHLPFASEDPGREDNCSRRCRHTCLALSAAVTPGGLLQHRPISPRGLLLVDTHAYVCHHHRGCVLIQHTSVSSHVRGLIPPRKCHHYINPRRSVTAAVTVFWYMTASPG